MKYFPRLNLYKAANVTFDPSTVVATSYDWWCFVTVIRGRVVFNEYPYSATTRKHQAKVKALMAELGITPDIVVSTRLSLGNVNALEDAMQGALKEAEFFEGKAATARSLRGHYLSIAGEQLQRAEAIKQLIKMTERVAS